jgi:crotonobetainyl-CoA:carnitine CoA-transferase CaiB-like acyl-CoA transferase
VANPLSGVRVLDLSVWRPGPCCTQLLHELGADIQKIEPPGGDPMRAFPELFASLNTGKETRRVDLKTDAGREEVLDLAASSDVVVEGFRPGVVMRLGVGPSDVQARNPGVVYCSISGFGQTGPLAAVPGHDLTYMAWAGALSPDGAEPVSPRIPVADLAAGMAAAMRICAACVRRRTTGEGAVLDIAMADVLATWTGPADARMQGSTAATRTIPGYGTFATRDGGWVALGVLDEDPFWTALCRALGLDGDADLSFAARTARTVVLQGAIAGVIAGRDRDGLVADLLGAGVPVAPVLDRPGMLALEHFRARGVTG